MSDADNRFNSRAEIAAHFRQCLARSVATLDMFDPDFAVFPIGASDTEESLRVFLRRGGHLRLAMHETGHIERDCPRFTRLLQDYSHRIECRVTSRPLRTLTDSFCIGDGVHIVRRFHSDHARGEAVFDSAAAAEVSRERFVGIWAESLPGIHASTTGL